jgi:hypothetical protein
MRKSPGPAGALGLKQLANGATLSRSWMIAKL